jgi:DNA-directed RNA polymerase subunit L
MDSTTTRMSKFSFQLRGVPVPFPNAIRRILLNETPVVEITDVQILENTTLVPHELLKHRTEMLPVNVRVTEEDTIREARLTLRYEKVDAPTIVTTNDFAVSGTRTDILLKDRDLGTPLFFTKLKKGEAIHITARLTINQKSSQVCLATYNYHVDEEKALIDAEKYEGDDKKVFENFYKQKSYYLNEKGRPDWFDINIESLGVVPAKDLVRGAVQQIRQRIRAWSKEPIIRDRDNGTYLLTTTKEGHTIGALAQAVGYDLGMCSVVSYDVPHPLRPDMNFKFHTDKEPQAVLDAIATKVEELCDATISSIDK